ncbi:MAG: hypothetical protein U0Y82_01580 [Thermoleophilia bacterium]
MPASAQRISTFDQNRCSTSSSPGLPVTGPGPSGMVSSRKYGPGAWLNMARPALATPGTASIHATDAGTRQGQAVRLMMARHSAYTVVQMHRNVRPTVARLRSCESLLICTALLRLQPATAAHISASHRAPGSPRMRSSMATREAASSDVRPRRVVMRGVTSSLRARTKARGEAVGNWTVSQSSRRTCMKIMVTSGVRVARATP